MPGRTEIMTKKRFYEALDIIGIKNIYPGEILIREQWNNERTRVFFQAFCVSR